MEEAQYVADRLGIRLLTLPIDRVMTGAKRRWRRYSKGVRPTSPKKISKRESVGCC